MDEVNRFAHFFKYDEMITIALEDGETEYDVQRASLCHASTYFNSALQRGFKEASDKKLRLPGCDAEVLRVFLYWLTRQFLPNFPKEIREVEDAEQKRGLVEERCVLLVKIWLFADAYLIPKLKDKAMSDLFDIAERHGMTCSIIRQAYVMTPKDSDVREFFLKAARDELFYGSLSTQDLEVLAQTPGFMTDFMAPVKAFVTKSDPENKEFSLARWIKAKSTWIGFRDAAGDWRKWYRRVPVVD